MRKNHKAAKDPCNFEFQFGPAVRMDNMSGGSRKSHIVIHFGPFLI